ncbi:MAG: putative Ig domain-containing protein, partial [Pseudoxanthomonas sp.]
SAIGTLSGTPTAAGTFNFTLTTTDSSTGTGPYTGSRAYSFTVAGPPAVTSITPTSGPTTGGSSVVISGTNFSGTTAVTFGATSATGFTVNSATQITAIAPAGTGTVDVRVTNAGGTSNTSAADQFTYVARPAVTSITPSAGPATGGTMVTITGSGFSGTTAVTFGATAATGFTVNSATQITATAPAGTGTVDVRVTNAGGTSPAVAQDQFTYVAPPVVTSVTPSTGPAAGGTSVTINGTGFTGATALKFGAANGIAATVVSATQITATAPAGSGSGNVTVTTAGGTSATNGQNLFTYVAPPIAGALSATVAYGSSVNPITLNLSGGVATSVAVATGAAHGTATASGTSISYTPTVGYAGSDSFTYTATNASGTSAPATVTITVSAPLMVLSPAGGTLPLTYGAAYSQTFTGSGGSAPYSYALIGTLPAGLSLNAGTGVLSGTPTQPGNFPVTITATDSSGGSAAPFSITNNYTLTVSAPTLLIAPATLPATTAGLSYSASVSASAGIAPYAFTVTGGALPTGLVLNNNGTLSGVTTASGSFNFTVTATDAHGQTGARAYTVAVAVPTLVLGPATLPGGTAGNAYSQVLTTSGGFAPYTVALTGTLPTGLSFNAATATLSGTPTQSGAFNLSVTATDSTSGTPATVTNAYVLNIAAPTLALTPATGTVLNAPYGVVFSQVFTASGSPGPYTYVLSGALPTGVTFSGDTLSGTPTTPGSYSISVTATDTGLTGAGAPFTVTHNFALNVSAPTLAINPATLPDTTAGLVYNESLSASGGVAPYAFTVSSGIVPTGLTLNTNGSLSGTSTASGSFNFTVTATDAHGQNMARAYTVVVVTPTLTLTPALLADGIAGTAYNQS